MALVLSVDTLKKNDINDKFSVPKEWVDEYWPNIGNNCDETIRVRHQVSLRSEKWYDFVLSTRANGPKKTVFKRKGWQMFVKDNDLRERDIVRFGKRDGETHFTIIIERKHVL